MRFICFVFTFIRNFKYYSSGLGNYFRFNFTITQVTHNYRTRFATNENISHPAVHSSKVFCSFSYIEMLLWNICMSSSSLNEILYFVFKHVADIISPILCDLFKESVHNGSFPYCLKISRIFPTLKSGSKTDVKNFRPKPILPFINKVFDSLIHSRLYDFLLTTM